MFATSSSTPFAPAYQSKSMITGRVCKNLMGLFSNGVTETLEVKLRLVPVPTCVQTEYIKSMEKYRSASPATSAGFDPNAWTASLQPVASQDPSTTVTMGLTGINGLFDSGFHSDNLDRSLMDATAHTVRSYRHQRQSSIGSFHQDSRTVLMTGQSVPVSRTTSPAPSIQSASFQHDTRGQPFRPSSRTSTRSNYRPMARHESFEQTATEHDPLEGPPKKRAKIVQADWHGKSVFGPRSDSLRVTASTAASIRLGRPASSRPSQGGGESLEPPPRAPTPIPRLSGSAQSRTRHSCSSGLRRGSSVAMSDTYQSPYEPLDDFTGRSDISMTPPEEDQNLTAEGTPIDFPSSPPMLPAPSSPQLPCLPRLTDSGYMSSSITGPCEDEDENRSIDEEDLQIAAQYSQRVHLPLIERTDKPVQASTQGVIEDSATTSKACQSRSNTDPPALPVNGTLEPPRRGSLALPVKRPQPQSAPEISPVGNVSLQDKIVAAMPLAQLGSASIESTNLPPAERHRTSSFVHEFQSDAGSPAPGDLGGKPRSGAGAKRVSKRQLIDKRLTQSLEKGEMPHYCANCGAIQTPTWRSVFVKTFQGSPDGIETKDGDGEVTSIEAMETDKTTGKVTQYRVIKSMKKGKLAMYKDGFAPLQVCNPCGLWFNKFKAMRPEERWTKKPPSGKRSRQQRLKKAPAEPQEAQSDYITDQPSALYSDAVQYEVTTDDDPQLVSVKLGEQKQASSARRRRSNSMQAPQAKVADRSSWDTATLDAELQRAIQSSPVRFCGTQESPIELDADESPNKPIRRLLFPSPRKDGETKSLDDSALGRHSDVAPTRGPFATTGCDISILEDVTVNKENLPPQIDVDDEFAHLFDSPSNFRTPNKLFRTPTSKSRSESGARDHMNELLKTPSPPSRRKPFSPKSGNANTFPALLSTPSRTGLTPSPSRFGVTGELTPFTASLHRLLSENNADSPGQSFIFGTPGKSMVPELDFGALWDDEAMNVDGSLSSTDGEAGNDKTVTE
ncbi:hypothetical protein LTR66_007335 [Elasticomyces elasticus]|nr:hypothetical protein LTR66_007335 [Elasticomyces elasticus]KAK4988781.1 hypothetical protein LTR50_003745 [Elasticomyces elasticus]